MKYLAAYALLSLSGKKNISTNDFTQTLLTSNPFSATLDLKFPTTISRDVLTVSSPSPSTS